MFFKNFVHDSCYVQYILQKLHVEKLHLIGVTGLEIATDTVANASTTFNLATKNSTLVATLATMFL